MDSSGGTEEALARQVIPERIPRHVAIIMDGNGRWAAQRHLPRVEGHRAGIDAGARHRGDLGPARPRGAHALRVLGRELEAPGHRSQRADGAAAPLPAARARHAAPQQHPLPRHRPAQRVARRRLRRAAGGRDQDPPQHRHAVQHRAQLRRPGRDRRCRPAVPSKPACRPRRSTRRALPSSSTPPASPIPICSSAPAARCGSATSCSGRSPTPRFWVTDTLWPDFRCQHLLEAVVAYQKRDRRYGGIASVPVAARRQVDIPVHDPGAERPGARASAPRARLVAALERAARRGARRRRAGVPRFARLARGVGAPLPCWPRSWPRWPRASPVTTAVGAPAGAAGGWRWSRSR